MVSLRSEEEILATWTSGDIEKPLVTIRCNAYNHELYIEDAIIGFLRQETSFPIEIWIHDDASTDGTALIIKRYQAAYPRLIRSVLQTENQYSKGKKPGQIMIPYFRGKYIAMCEGDDYWISEKKLALQIEAMESHEGIDMSFHSARKLDVVSGEEEIIGRYAPTTDIVKIEDIITKRHGQIPTAATVVTSQALRDYAEYLYSRPHLAVGDIYMHFFGAKRGGAIYVNEIMSVYRASVPGSWNDRTRKDFRKQLHHAQTRISSYRELNGFTNSIFSKEFSSENSKYIRRIFRNIDIPCKYKLEFYKCNFSSMGLFERIQYACLAIVPISILRFAKNTKNSVTAKINKV